MAEKYASGETWKTGSSLRKQRLEMYLSWILTPPQERTPQGKKEFAAQLGVDLSTLWRYEQDRWFQEELMARRRSLFKVIDVEAVLKNLVVIASDPGNKQAVSAARTLLEWSEKAQSETTAAVNLDDLTHEELMELANELYARSTVESIAAEDTARAAVEALESRP